MDATLKQRTQELASALATQSSTIGDLNAAMRELMKSALEKILHTEMDVHLESTQSAPQELLRTLNPMTDRPLNAVAKPDETRPAPRRSKATWVCSLWTFLAIARAPSVRS